MEESHVGIASKKNKNVDSVFTLFSNLTAEKNQNPKYCVELVKSLRGERFNIGSVSNFGYSIKRIVRGLGSTRLHSQCGCFAALTCVLKYQACSVEDVLEVLEKEQQPAQGATKSEIGALNTGCVLTCGAIIHSGLFTSQSAEVQLNVLKKLIEAGKKKSYLSFVTCRFLVDVVNMVNSQQFKEIVWPLCKSEFLEDLDKCGADTFYLLINCLKKNEKTVSKFLEKNDSSPDILMDKIIIFLFNNNVKSSHPIYETIGQFLCVNTKFLVKFWSKCVNENSKASFLKENVLINIFYHIIKNIEEVVIVPKLLVPKFIEAFMKILSFKKTKNSKDDDCLTTAKTALNCMITLLNAETTSDETRFEAIKKLLFYPANMKFENKTGTKCINSLISNLKLDCTKKLLGIYRQIISGELKKIVDEEGTEEIWNNKEKQHALHTFVKTLNHHSIKNEISLKLDQIKFVFEVGFLKKVQLPSEVQKCAKECFYKAIILQMPSLKDLVSLLDKLAVHVNENIENKSLKVSEEIITLWNKMFSTAQKMRKKSNNKLFIAVHILLIYMGFQLFLDSELAKSGIEELLSCYEHLKGVHKKKKKEDSSEPHWTEVTVDLILSLLSRENKLWRHVVSCIFPQVVPHITPTALNQIIDALDPKSQNQVLNHINSDDSESEPGSGEESESSLSEGSDVEDYEEEGKVNDQLRMAVRNALGYSAALTDDESIDMDQMGEEEEKKLNDSLAEAFRAFKSKNQGKKKKQSKEEEALTHFRLRVLDLVEIYVSNSPPMSGCLDLILPLLDILELSVKDHHQRPLQNRVDSVLKHISTLKNFSDVEGVTQKVIKDLFESVISRKEISALVFVEMSPRIADCTSFLVRCSKIVPKSDSEIPLVDEYNSLLKAYFQCRDFRLPISMFQAVMRMGWMGNFKIAATLFEFLAVSNLRIFKKMKIIELLRIFYKNDKLHSSCDEQSKLELINIETDFINNFTVFLSEYEKNESKSSEKMYLSFFSNMITLINLIYNHSKKRRQDIKRRTPWEKVISKMTEMEIISGNKKTRSQLANIANAFKVTMPAIDKTKRNRTVSESSSVKNEGEEEVEEENEEKVKKKAKKKRTAEKMKLKNESRKMREEISSNGLEEIRFSMVDTMSLPEPEVDSEETETPSKKRKLKEVEVNGVKSKEKVKRKKNQFPVDET